MFLMYMETCMTGYKYTLQRDIMEFCHLSFCFCCAVSMNFLGWYNPWQIVELAHSEEVHPISFTL